MGETAEGPARRVSSLFIVIILIVLVMSIGALYLAIAYFESGKGDYGAWFMLLGFSSLALSTYMMLQTRRKAVRLPFEAPKVITTILCQKCELKNIRDFQRGDYILKETEPCPKCNEKMVISSIYREVKEKEKG